MQQSILLHTGLVTPDISVVSLIFYCQKWNCFELFGKYSRIISKIFSRFLYGNLSKIIQNYPWIFPKKFSTVSPSDNRKSRRQSDSSWFRPLRNKIPLLFTSVSSLSFSSSILEWLPVLLESTFWKLISSTFYR